MKIISIGASNFKSFSKFEVELNDYNIIIGSNASGKSNFISLFRLIKNASNYGIERAISYQGGFTFLRNVNIEPSNDTSFEIEIDTDENIDYGTHKIRINKIKYSFSINFLANVKGIDISNEIIKINCIVKKKSNGKTKRFRKTGEGTILIDLLNNNVVVDGVKLPPAFLKTIIKSRFYVKEKKDLRLGSRFIFLYTLENLINKCAIFNFDPQLITESHLMTGLEELDENGSNLPFILKNIFQNEERKRTFLNLINDVLPFINDIDIETMWGKFIPMKFQEEYSKKQYLPASLMSEGTINLLKIVVALFFDERKLIFIEEPEKSIHPSVIHKLTNMIKEASQHKQIIITTHNPELIRNADPSNILLLSRDDKGYSVIHKPTDHKEIRVFLENEIGIDELFIQNLLSG